MASNYKSYLRNTKINGKAITVYLDRHDVEKCDIALHNLLSIPKHLREGLFDIAEEIIVPKVDEVRYNGGKYFVGNAEGTIKRKGLDQPWFESNAVVGSGYVTSSDGGDTLRVSLSGENSYHEGSSVSDIIRYVHEGTPTIPERPLFLEAWELCKSKVQSEVNFLFREYMK